jgi:hypothetical protein
MMHEIVELLGHAAAARLVLAFNGREIRVPVRHKGRTWVALVQAIGEQDAARFCDYFQGERLYIAGSQRLHTEFNRRRAAVMRAQGKSWCEIAKRLATPGGARASCWRSALGEPPRCCLPSRKSGGVSLNRTE